jgi:hypothetical protein
MGNMTNIFPPQVERMLFVKCPPERQEELAQQICREIQILQAARKTVQDSLLGIHSVIERATREESS